MEVITIEKKAFEEMKTDFEELVSQAKALTERFKKPMSEQWLDAQDVCTILDVSKRTLQAYKDKGLLPAAKINRKNYFKASDVQELLKTKCTNDNTLL